jgi:hypothetical protein
MTSRTADMPAAPPCHVCGYDLRAHLPDEKCPECGASVAESVRLAAIPIRPAWRDSDPRWRRRMVAGMWILVLLPLADALQALGWASSVPAPNIFGTRGAVHTLDETLLFSGIMDVYQPLIFCMGGVLLFSKERGRRRGRLDWTRRWGILCSYVVFLLSAIPVLFIGALVLVGIAALFLSIPIKFQPEVTQWLVNVSTAYLRYGPYPSRTSYYVVVAFSSTVILLACAPLLDALRSSGPKRLALILLGPLAAFALLYLVQVGCSYLGSSIVNAVHVTQYGVYFYPQAMVKGLGEIFVGGNYSGSWLPTFFVETLKWCIVLAIAIWLSIAQLVAWRKRKKGITE